MSNIEIKDLQFISSRQNPLVLYVCKLAEKKHRQKEGKFRIDGIKLFGEALQKDVDIETVLLMESRAEKILGSIGNFLTNATGQKFDIKIISDGVFEKISEEKSPEGVICIAKDLEKIHKIATAENMHSVLSQTIQNDKKIFCLESIRDPGNLGTIIRSAVAFDVDLLLISSDCAELYNPKTIRAAMGTLFSQKIVIADNFPSTIDFLTKSGRMTYAATLSEKTKLLGHTKLELSDCIVVGNEGHGLTEDTINACKERILIPMTANAESLNAGIASSVLMWEQFGKNM